MVNHLLEHDFLSDIQPQSLLDELDRVPLSEKAPIFNENPPIVGRPQDSGTRRTLYGNYGGANHHKHYPHKLHDLPVLKRVADRVLETAKKTVVGGVGWSCTILDMSEISSYDHTPQHLHRDAPPYTIPEGTLIVNCLIMLTHNHEEEDGSHFLFVPSSSSGFPDPWVERAVPFKRGTAFFFNALDVHRGSGIPKASPTGVRDPRLMAFLVEQAAATGVEAALAKGRLADQKLALVKAEKVQGNTQRALDQALNLAAKRVEEVEAMREALREAQEGRRKAEVEAAKLRVKVEGQQRRGDDLQQRLGVAEAQVRSLTSTLSASFTAQHGLAPQGVQSQGSGSRSGSQ